MSPCQIHQSAIFLQIPLGPCLPSSLGAPLCRHAPPMAVLDVLTFMFTALAMRVVIWTSLISVRQFIFHVTDTALHCCGALPDLLKIMADQSQLLF